MSRLSRWLLDLVFPPSCVHCGKRGEWMCAGCLDGIPFRTDPRALDGIDAMVSVGPYADPALRALITGFKYESATCLEPAFRTLLRRWNGSHGVPWGPDGLVIVPVPSSEDRILERGFDHVSKLSEIIRDVLWPDRPVSSILKRKRQVLSNADLDNDDARRGNVLGAFSVESVVPERIVLVDDVVTSGATAVECAQLLKNQGARKVYLFTCAQGG